MNQADPQLLVNLFKLSYEVGQENRLEPMLQKIVREVSGLTYSDEAALLIASQIPVEFTLTAYGSILQTSRLSDAKLENLVAQTSNQSQATISNNLSSNLDEQETGENASALHLVHRMSTALPRINGILMVYRYEISNPFKEADAAVLIQTAQFLEPLLYQAHRAEQLEQSLQARDSFVSVISHDLRNPLASLRGYAQLTSRRLEKTEPGQSLPREMLQANLQRMIKQTDAVNDMIEKMLDFSRILSQRFELNLEPTDLAALTGDTLKYFQIWLNDQERSTSPEKRHILEFENSSQPLLSGFDRSRLNQVINSLLHNAFKFSFEGGPIIVRLRQQDSTACLSVADQGIGIAPEKQASVFHSWKRSEDNREAGLGVSLFIADEVLRQHGGELSFETNPGQGSTFTMKLPLTTQKKEESQANYH